MRALPGPGPGFAGMCRIATHRLGVDQERSQREKTKNGQRFAIHERALRSGSLACPGSPSSKPVGAIVLAAFALSAENKPSESGTPQLPPVRCLKRTLMLSPEEKLAKREAKA